MFHQHLFLGVNKLVPVIIGDFIFVTQKDRFLGTGFLAKSAENTADHVYFIHRGVSFTLFVFRRFHVDGIGGASGGA